MTVDNKNFILLSNKEQENIAFLLESHDNDKAVISDPKLTPYFIRFWHNLEAMPHQDIAIEMAEWLENSGLSKYRYRPKK